MAFDWREFFLFAHQLRNEINESKQRTSIGRAYYYAYHAALTEAKKLGFNRNAPNLKSMGMHRRLWYWCQTHSNQDIVTLGDSGNTLQGRRTAVDYYLNPAPTMQTVHQQLAETRDFELLLARVADTPTPPPLPTEG